MKKDITLKEHLQGIAKMGGEIRWKDKTPEQKKEHSKKMTDARWKETREKIAKESKKNVVEESFRNNIN